MRTSQPYPSLATLPVVSELGATPLARRERARRRASRPHRTARMSVVTRLPPRGSFDDDVAAGLDVVRAIIARSLRVTLSDNDGRERNQDALDLVGDVTARLVDALRGALESGASGAAPAGPIRDVRAFSARLAYRGLSDYWDARRPGWRRLCDRLHYFMTHRAGWSVWRSPEGDLVAGRAEWAVAASGSDVLDGPAVERYRADPKTLGVGPLSAGTVERVAPADWERVLARIFGTTRCPIRLHDLVRLVLSLFGTPTESTSSDASGTASGDESRQAGGVVVVDGSVGSQPPSPEEWARARIVLGRALREIAQLTPAHRAAYLLNIKETLYGIGGFVEDGLTTILDLGRLIGLTVAQYEIAWAHLPLDDATRAEVGEYGDDERFALLWNHLPLRDRLIARMLGGGETPQDVSNLRMVARRRIRRRLEEQSA